MAPERIDMVSTKSVSMRISVSIYRPGPSFNIKDLKLSALGVGKTSSNFTKIIINSINMF